MRADSYKTDLAAFLAGHPLVLMNLFRDTYDLMTDGATFVTRGQEWDRIAATHNLADFQMASVYAKTYPALWLRQARQMAERINRSGVGCHSCARQPDLYPAGGCGVEGPAGDAAAGRSTIFRRCTG